MPDITIQVTAREHEDLCKISEVLGEAPEFWIPKQIKKWAIEYLIECGERPKSVPIDLPVASMEAIVESLGASADDVEWKILDQGGVWWLECWNCQFNSKTLIMSLRVVPSANGVQAIPRDQIT